MKNAALYNAQVSQAIKSVMETVEDFYMCSNCSRLENRLMTYVDNANSEDMTVEAYVKADAWDNFAAVVYTVATGLGFKASFIEQVQKAVSL